MSDLRKTFFEELIKIADEDNTIRLLVNDVGYSFFETFKERHPDKFFNLGITEQTIMGVAAGMALSGLKPYVYSMINFVLFRPYEQLRNDVCYQNANVKVVGVSGSAAYKFLGPSHNVQPGEDLEILKTLPNIGIYIPKEEKHVVSHLREIYAHDGPDYIKL